MANLSTEDRLSRHQEQLSRHRGRLAAYEHAIFVVASRLDVNGDVAQEIREGESRHLPKSRPMARETYVRCLNRLADRIEKASKSHAVQGGREGGE